MKMKTHQATAKRFRVTGRKKIFHRSTHQDHFNARERSVNTRKKRKVKKVHRANLKRIKRLLPHSF